MRMGLIFYASIKLICIIELFRPKSYSSRAGEEEVEYDAICGTHAYLFIMTSTLKDNQ